MTQPKSALAASKARKDISQIYREIFEHSIDGIAIIGADGFYVEQNAAHEELTGFSDADLKGRTPSIHLGEEEFVRIAAALEQNGWFRGLVESRCKSGDRKKLELTAFAVRDKEGRSQYYIGIKGDITDQARVAAERDARLRELESLYGLTRAVNQALKLEDIYRFAIDALIRAIGADRASVLVFGDDGRMHFQAWQGLSEEYRRAVDGHSPWSREERDAAPISIDDAFLEPTLAAYIPVFIKEGIRSLSFVPIVFEGKLLGKFMIYYDQVHAFTGDEIRMAEAMANQLAIVIQKHTAEDALRRSEKLAAAGRLAATVAHEINNPLESVMNLAYLLGEEIGENANARQYLDALDSELRRVALITRRTLAFYRDRQPHELLHLVPLAEEIVQVFRPKLQANSIELRLSASGDPTVHGSAGELRQVILNLLSNAAEAVGKHGSIDIDLRDAWGRVVIEVADTGAGIEQAAAHRIFEPFFTTKTGTGTGLGLPLSREIIERHGGTIRAGNRREGGARFTVTLPSAVVEAYGADAMAS
jgi:PAS domain S-box-containing protein